MNTFFKILAAFGAAAGAILLAMKIIEASRRGADDRRHIALFKHESSVPTRKSGRLGTIAQKVSDEIADFRDGADDEDAYLFEDLDRSADELVYDDSAYDDIFGEDVTVDDIVDDLDDIIEEAEDILEDAADELEEISEDALSQLLDS